MYLYYVVKIVVTVVTESLQALVYLGLWASLLAFKSSDLEAKCHYFSRKEKQDGGF
nr:MAG TPA: hypothetical protein [Caudoviricetes sp.]